jgi:hypothetical protein
MKTILLRKENGTVRRNCMVVKEDADAGKPEHGNCSDDYPEPMFADSRPVSHPMQRGGCRIGPRGRAATNQWLNLLARSWNRAESLG